MEREKGFALGNVLTVARTAAAFYSNAVTRRTWILRFLRDVFGGDQGWYINGPYSDVPKVYPNWMSTVIDFCIGEIPVDAFREMAVAEYHVPTTMYKRIRTENDIRIELHDTLLDGTFFNPGESREVEDDGDFTFSDVYEHSGSNRESPRTEGSQIHFHLIWKYAVERLASATNKSYFDTDLKVEFERVYELDTLSGVNTRSSVMAAAESIKAIRPFGFLNNAAVFNDTSDNAVHYKSYLFGSNLLLIDNDITNFGVLDSSIPSGTDRRHLQRVLDMNASETERFIYNIVTVSGGVITNCPRYGGSRRDKTSKRNKRKRDRIESDSTFAVDDDDHLYEGTVQYTSFNKLNNSIQFTFNTHNRRNYFTANLFVLRADDYCTTDLVYRRSAVTSLCQCKRPTLAWRACVLVTPINSAKIEGGARVEVTKVVMAALTAFRSVYSDKKSTKDSRLAVLSGFLGLPYPSYLDKETKPDNGRSELTPLCVLHRWLRAHSGSEWTVYSGKDVLLRLLNERGGRAVLVRRPVLMTGTDAMSLGARSFIRYMSYEDSVSKVLRLTRSSLLNGLGDINCAVAYVRGSNDLVVFERAGISPNPVDDSTAAAQEQEKVGGPIELWNALFEAPSCMYIDVSVLATIGFNPVEFAPARTDRGCTFEHVDPITGDACTVFCSVPMRVVDDRSGTVVNETEDTLRSVDHGDDGDRADENGHVGINVLYNTTPYDSRLDTFRTLENNVLPNVSVHSRYQETVHDVGAFWPGVHLVRVRFVDAALKHVVFAFFTGTDYDQMSLENLYRLSDHCMRENLVPPPILYTVQRIVLNALYA